MAGRPYFVKYVTQSGSFPAGSNPWNGQPVGVQPAGVPTFYTPNLALPAEEVNFWAGNLFDQTIGALNWGGVGPAQNWSQQFAPMNSAPDSTALAWDIKNRQWLVANRYVGNGDVWATRGADGGLAAAWYSVSPSHVITFASTAAITGVAADPVNAGTYFAAVSGTSGTTTTTIYKSTGGGAWSAIRSPAASDTEHTKIITLEHGATNLIVYAVGAATNADTGLSYSTNGGSTWTDTFYSSATFSGGVSEFLLKTNFQGAGIGTDSQVLAVPYNTGGTGYIQATDGQTYAAETLPATHVVGLDWDSVRRLWIMATTGGGSDTTFWQSGDGINWTQIGGSFHLFQAADLACCGALYLATTVDVSQVSQQYFSPDGGISWYLTKAGFTTNETSGAGLIRALVADDLEGQFYTINSLNQRLSAIAGLPNASV